MALRWIDGFDYYTTAIGAQRGYGISSSPTINASYGRFGSSGLQTDDVDQMTAPLPNSATYIAGFAIYVSAFNNSGRWFSFLDSGSLQVELRWTSPYIRVTRNGTTLATATTTNITTSTWYYVEFKATINDTTGAYEVRVNGNTELSATGVDTQNTANANINGFAIGQTSGASGSTINWDDLYVLDSTGGAPTNNFLGDSRIECLFPNGNGNSSMFDGSDGNQVDNYLLVDEVSSDGDTTYVESADLNDKDTYAYTNLSSTSGTVYAVAPVPYFRKTTSGSKTLASVARLSGGTEEDSAAKMVLDTYVYNQDIRVTKPGGGAWSISDVNDAEFGIKVTA